MDNNEFIVSQLIANGETDSVCFKEELNQESIACLMVAMSNHRGGSILVGVDDTRNVCGVLLSDKTLMDFQIYIKENVSPRLPYTIMDVVCEGKHVLMISVWEGSVKPYLYQRKAFVMKGNAVIQADSGLLDDLFYNRAFHDESWERELCFTADISSLDIVRVGQVHEMINSHSIDFVDCSHEVFLEKQGLLVRGVPTNAAIVLFAEHPAQFLPQIRIRVSVFAGVENPSLVEVSVFEGNLFDNLERITDYCKSLYGTTLRIDGMTRKQIPLLPVVAFREALLNAMVHRDYSSHKSFLNIVVNADNLQISNFGSLPYGLTVEALSTEHLSILRNQDIANVCYLCNYIEMAGSGTLRILSECRLRKGMTVVWKEDSNVLTVILGGIKHLKGKRTEANPLRTTNTDLQKNIDNIVVFVGKNPGCKLQDIQQEIGKSLASTKRYIQMLRENGVLQYEGAPKNGGYKLIL